MPKRNQIPRLFADKPNARGITYWRWKPEKRLRLLGYSNVALGTNQAEAARRAIDLNADIAGNAPPPCAPGPARTVTFRELVARYKRSEEFANCADETKKGYRRHLATLEEWALDGQMPITALDKLAVRQFKEQGLAIDDDGNTTGKVPILAARMRVLKLLLNWAVDQNLLEYNPALGVKIPRVSARRTRRDWPTVLAASETADASGCPYTGPYLRFAFWLAQRPGDMLRISRHHYREIANCDPRDRDVLGDRFGRVMGLAIHQNKTDEPVMCPVPPFLHHELEWRFERAPFLFPAMRDPHKPARLRTFQEKTRATMNTIGLDDVQRRDMRRSGMSFLNDMGSDESDIRAVSGHKVPGEKRMMEVYMPRNQRKACRAVADALRAMADLEARAKALADAQG